MTERTPGLGNTQGVMRSHGDRFSFLEFSGAR